MSGVWMYELMAAVDRDDQEFLARVRKIGIDPKTLASKIVMIMNLADSGGVVLPRRSPSREPDRNA